VKVLAYVHGYPPQHNAGAENMLHTILRWLVARGHEARVILEPGGQDYERDGVQVFSIPDLDTARHYRWISSHAQWADFILTHLDFTYEASDIARVNARPIVHLVHNEGQLGYHRITRAALVIFNSQWVSDVVAWKGGPQIIVRPPVFVDDYRVDRAGDAITLVATIELKGVRTFFEMARRMPERHFIGVRGSYNLNLDTDLPNVEMVPNSPAIRAVYERTRILVVPSQYESWSRCAIEAACSGIPVIAAPTPGLRESLGEAGLFADWDDVNAWCTLVERLDDPRTYGRCSNAVAERAAELQERSEKELVELESALGQVR
jgi:glycosyltransferase involved in cell wall biosynthesis